jgi:hypothetical protein
VAIVMRVQCEWGVDRYDVAVRCQKTLDEVQSFSVFEEPLVNLEGCGVFVDVMWLFWVREEISRSRNFQKCFV